ncbi:oligosaccharide flippase family protein [Microbacterium sp. ASV81]|uniref:Oligosaccharide flippase family protein n=1 Tax=Microbacterium capsulatum TaxID=3041921 RepID=A0ABU0XI54_9MICO|nr:oligosaccharide flippase family protein [Microbacterium sp. ASV81]MDQ4214248.1 oligosaccharide flippase family protein [Microbacterium sp. ASV81]
MISAILLLPVLLSFGSPTVLRVAAAGDEVAISQHVRSVRLLAVLSATVTGCGVLVAFPFLQSQLSSSVVLSFAIALPVCVLTGILWIGDSSVLIGRGETVQYALTLAAPSVSFAGAVTALWATGALSVASSLWAQVFSYVVTLALSSTFVRARLTGTKTPVLRLLRLGGRFAPGQIAEAASYRLDQILVLPVIGAYAAGNYAISVTIALLPDFVAQVVSAAAFRQSARDHRDGATDGVRLVRLLALVGLLAAVPLAIAAPWGIELVFGTEFSDAVVPTLIGLGGAVFLATSQGCVALLSIHGRGWLISFAQAGGLVVSIVLLFVLGPLLGATGAAIASSIGYLLSTSVLLIGLRSRWLDLALRPSDFKALLAVLLGRPF